ncbi:hypothetical protein C2G38_2212780 [Gigaspora rosea]|uniref:Uncharacterized protein n=1 Tax=Gigaspora rosea TaxID=44941 RepID=A0A397UCE1_9GLOM|nr:hypothetical protein C2G38_2212780 [Gigaspora rosea]
MKWDNNWKLGINFNDVALLENSPSNLFFFEASKDERNCTRKYGYSTINNRAYKKTVFIRGTILPALILAGIIAIDVIEGSCDKEYF